MANEQNTTQAPAELQAQAEPTAEQPTQPQQEAPKQPTSNGVTRPKSGTATGRVWEICDELSAKAGQPAARKDVIAVGKSEGLNEATITTQHGRWRKFHGLKGQTPKPAAATEATGEAEEGAPVEEVTAEA